MTVSYSYTDSYNDRLMGYEQEKVRLSRAALPYPVYEQAIKALAKKWGV